MILELPEISKANDGVVVLIPILPPVVKIVPIVFDIPLKFALKLTNILPTVCDTPIILVMVPMLVIKFVKVLFVDTKLVVVIALL